MANHLIHKAVFFKWSLNKFLLRSVFVTKRHFSDVILINRSLNFSRDTFVILAIYFCIDEKGIAHRRRLTYQRVTGDPS